MTKMLVSGFADGNTDEVGSLYADTYPVMRNWKLKETYQIYLQI